MAPLDVERKQSKQFNWMIPIISDHIRFEYEKLLRTDPAKRMQLEASHRRFWDALLTSDQLHARDHIIKIANDLSAIGLDILAFDSIDITIMDNLSEMILVRSKTQKTRSRSELKTLMQAAVLKGEIRSWWRAQHKYVVNKG